MVNLKLVILSQNDKSSNLWKKYQLYRINKKYQPMKLLQTNYQENRFRLTLKAGFIFKPKIKHMDRKNYRTVLLN
jgi:hypothetical protein